jgi:hypothetical protein
VPLAETSGEIDVDGVVLLYEVAGRRLTLRTRADRAFEFLLSVEVRDDRGGSANASRCIRFEPSCEKDVRYVPRWEEYRAVYLQRFGVVEAAPPARGEGGPPGDVTIRAGSRTST